MKILIYLIHLIFLSISAPFAKEICSRVATVNYQEVLVDLSNTQKGEGLKFYLDQDPVSKSYLKTYKENSQRKWHNAIMGSIGAILIFFSITTHGATRRNYLFTGGAIFAINYLTAKTLEYSNEKNLIRAVDEYNKRNLPKIYFGSEGNGNSKSVYLEKKWKF